VKDYFILKRKIVSDSLYFLERFSKHSAWLDMIYLANWDTGEVKQGLDIIILKRGEFCHSENYLCSRWKWSKGKVRRFLNWCIKDERLTIRQIVTRSSHRRNVVRLVNYNKHQFPIADNDNKDDNKDDKQDSKETNNKPNNKSNKVVIEEVLNHLNKLTGKNFKSSTKDYQRTISARLSEGYSLDDFKKVTELKFNEWKNDTKFSKFLRPATLYCAKHFDSYLNSDNPQKSLQENSFQNLYNSELVRDNSMKIARKIFKVGLVDLTQENARIYFEESIPRTWRDDEDIKNAYNEYLNTQDNKEANL
jgi:uncharacterized phage protein (TIGR02220 family)